MSEFDTFTLPNEVGEGSPPIVPFPAIPGKKDATKPLDRLTGNAKTMRELAAGKEKELSLKQAGLTRRQTEARGKSEEKGKALEGDLHTAEADLAAVPAPAAAVLPDPHIGEVVDKKNLTSAVFAMLGMSLIGAAGGRGNWKMATAGIDGALKGYKEGSLVKYKENVENYKREYDQALEKERESIKKYNEILKSKEYSINQKMRLIQLEAVKDNREELRFNAEAKNYEKVAGDIAKMRGSADAMDVKATQLYEKMVEAADKLQAKRDADKAKADAKGGSGGISDRYTNDAAYKKQIDHWAGLLNNGIALPGRFAQSVGQQFSKDVFAVAGQSTTSSEATANRLSMREMNAEAQKLGTQSASVAIANKELERFIPPALVAMEGVDRVGWRPLNTILQKAEDTWSPEQGKLVIAHRAVLNAYAQLIQRGAPTVHSLQEAEKMLTTADSKAVYKAKLEQLVQEGKQAELGLKDAHDDLMKRAREMGNAPSSAAPAAPYADPDKEARYQKWKAEHGGQ